MGNVHDSVEVASLVRQGDLMPFYHHPTIDLVVLIVPKSLLVNHLRYGLGTILALSDQHVQPSYLFVFTLDCLFNPCMIGLESIISILEQIEQPLLVEPLESSVALGLALELSQRPL
jgi:hypothetical protein